MPHPIYGPPSHALDRLVITIEFDPTGGYHLTGVGSSLSKRGSLWSYRADFEQTQQIEVSDHVAHLTICALQDTPLDQERLEYSLSGGLGWEDIPLFE